MLNNKFITDPGNMDAYCAYLEQLFTTKDVKQTRLLNEGFVKNQNTTILLIHLRPLIAN